MGATPLMKKSNKALDGHWVTVAIVNLALIVVCLVHGLLTEKAPEKLKGKIGEPFALKKARCFEEYTDKRMVELIKSCRRGPGRPEPAIFPSDVGVKETVKQIVRPLNSDTAFYYPTKMLVGLLLALFTFVYMLIESLSFQRQIKKGLLGLMQKSTEQVLQFGIMIEGSYQ